jgi:hypothetical protein
MLAKHLSILTACIMFYSNIFPTLLSFPRSSILLLSNTLCSSISRMRDAAPTGESFLSNDPIERKNAKEAPDVAMYCPTV